MENIKFEITEEDIKKYLKQHKDDESIKYREALFVKYMRENRNLIKESLEMMIKKDKNIICEITAINMTLKEPPYYLSYHLTNFDNYLNKIKNVDLSGICHILIPTLGYYGNYQYVYRQIGANYPVLKEISNELINKVPTTDELEQQVELALDDYYFVGKIDKDKGAQQHTTVQIYMSVDHCRKELEKYSLIYGNEPVKVIRKSIRERLR